MKRIVFFAVVAVATIAACIGMAETAMSKAQSIFSAVTVNPVGTYTGTCYHVDMGGDTIIPDVSGVVFDVASGGLDNWYKFTGTVYIEVDAPIGHVEHWIDFYNMEFSVDPTSDVITGVKGGGEVTVHINGIPVGSYNFETTVFTGEFTSKGGIVKLDFHFEAKVTDLWDFPVSFDFCGTNP
jgi:hypothetical protein